MNSPGAIALLVLGAFLLASGIWIGSMQTERHAAAKHGERFSDDTEAGIEQALAAVADPAPKLRAVRS